MKKWLTCMVTLTMLITLITGCTANQSGNTSVSAKIKILYYDKDAFLEEYGDFFSLQYPNVEFDVISTQDIDYASESDSTVAYEKFIEKERPDIIIVQADQYEQLVHDGYLTSLDQFIEKDKYSLDTIYPAITSMLRELGGGKLYGLSPKFYYQALYYNIDLFNQYGVDLPTNNMTWEELLTLAQRFPTNFSSTDRIYGLGIEDLSADKATVQLADKIAFTQNLNDVNFKSGKITADTESWKNIWRLSLETTTKHALYDQASSFTAGSSEEFYQTKPFLMGKMAMTIDDSYLIEYMKQAKHNIKNYKELNYGIVTAPVDASNPGKTRDIRLEEIFAIRNGSENIDFAWDVIKLINGEEFAKIKSHAMNGSLLSRTGYYNEFNNIDAFYSLIPTAVDYYKDERYADFYKEFNRIKAEQIGLVEEKKESIDEAVAVIQSQGQALLDQTLKKQKN